MTKETFPHGQNGLVTLPQEHILLPQSETTEADWPIHDVRFNRKLGILIVDVDETGLIGRLVEEPGLFELGEHGFQPKQGLHMTVINYENGEQIHRALKSMPLGEQEEMLQAVEDMAESTDWSWRPTGELQPFKGQKKKGLKIITRVKCPAFDTFYDGLSQLMPTAQFKLYPPHITLLKQPGEISQRMPSSIGRLVLGRPLLSLNYPTIDS